MCASPPSISTKTPTGVSSIAIAVGDDGLVLFAELHDTGLHGPFEGQQALAVLVAHPQDAAALIEPIVLGVEQTVLLQPAAAEG
jgi:hypothetical protein